MPDVPETSPQEENVTTTAPAETDFDDTKISGRVPAELKLRVKVHAVRNGMSIQRLLEEALSEYLERHEKKGPN